MAFVSAECVLFKGSGRTAGLTDCLALTECLAAAHKLIMHEILLNNFTLCCTSNAIRAQGTDEYGTCGMRVCKWADGWVAGRQSASLNE